MPNKRKLNQHKHVRKRLRQRFNIKKYNSAIRKDWINKIKNHGTEYIGQLTNTKTVHLIIYDGKKIYVIYDKIRNNPCSVYTEDMLEGKL